LKIKYLVSFFLIHAISVCLAQNILVWRNDNKSTFSIPEEPSTVNCDYGIKKALIENGYSYTLSPTLPDELAQYDIIFITLGFSVDCG
jgi:hypothetical protein